MDVCDHHNLNFIAHRILGGQGEEEVAAVDQAVGRGLRNRVRAIQLLKSGMQKPYLPDCVKGVAVGLNRLSSSQAFLDVLLRPNTADDHVVSRYWDAQAFREGAHGYSGKRFYKGARQ